MRLRSYTVVTTFLLASSVAVGLPAGPAGAATQGAAAATCGGQAATIVATTPDQTLTGTPGDDVISGGSGANTIDALDGNDVICPGAGDDAVTGGGGTDTVIFDGSQAVAASLTDGRATGQGRDSLAGVENLTGGAGNDTLTGNTAPNELLGGGGDDVLDGAVGNDQLTGGEGSDTAAFPSATAVVASLVSRTATGQGTDALTGVENLDGSPGDDTLTGNGEANVLDGALGNDRLDGVAGPDTADFSRGPAVTANLTTGTATGQGSDTTVAIENLTGSSGVDRLTGDGGPNVLDGGPGNDRLDGAAGQDTAAFARGPAVTANLATGVATGQGDDTFLALENLAGSPAADTLLGDTAVNVLRGGAGADTCDGKAGNDTAVECEIGIVTLAPAGSGDAFTYDIPAGQGTWVDSLSATATGGSLRWTLTGPDRTLFSNEDASVDRVVDSTLAGGHTLTVTGSSASVTGTVRFRLRLPVDVAKNTTVGTTVANAPKTTIVTPEPGQDASLTFPLNASPDKPKKLSVVITNETWYYPTFSLTDPAGNNVLSRSNFENGTYTAEYNATTAGTYRLSIDPYYGYTGQGTFQIIAPVDVVKTTTVGTTVANAPKTTIVTPEPGQDASLTFPLNASPDKPKKLSVVITNETWYYPTFSLTDPAGNNVLSRSNFENGTYTAEYNATTAGTYRLSIDPYYGYTGQGTFQIIAPVDVVKTTTVGTTVANAPKTTIVTPEPGQDASLTFPLNASPDKPKKLSVVITNETWYYPTFSLTDPAGNNVLSRSNFENGTYTAEYNATTAGTYRLSIDPYYGYTGQGTFQIIAPVDVVKTTTVGTTVANAPKTTIVTPEPGQDASLTFPLNASPDKPKKLSVVITNETWYYPTFSLTDPAGNNVLSRSNFENGTYTAEYNATTAGTYRLSIDPYYGYTGQGTFQIIAPVDVVKTTTVGTTVANAPKTTIVTPEPGQDASLTFPLNASPDKPKKLSVVITNETWYYPTFSLTDPAGNNVLSRSNFENGTYTAEYNATTAGTYRLSIDPYYGYTGQGTFQIIASPAT